MSREESIKQDNFQVLVFDGHPFDEQSGSNRTMAHLRGQRGPPGSVAPKPTTKLLYREESITRRQLLTLLSSNSSTISRFSLSMAIKRADRPNGSQQLMLRTPEVISGLANILKGKKDLYVIF